MFQLKRGNMKMPCNCNHKCEKCIAENLKKLDWSKPLQFSNQPTYIILAAYKEPGDRYHVITKDSTGYIGYIKVSCEGIANSGNKGWDVINKVEKVKINLIFGFNDFPPFIVSDASGLSYKKDYPNIKLVTIEVEVPQ